MLTVFIFSDRPHNFAFTYDKEGANLPKEGYGKWKYIETKNYLLKDIKLYGLPYSSRELKKVLDEKGIFIIDLKLFEQL